MLNLIPHSSILRLLDSEIPAVAVGQAPAAVGQGDCELAAAPGHGGEFEAAVPGHGGGTIAVCILGSFAPGGAWPHC